MSEKTKNLIIWCDNGHDPVHMIYSYESVLEEGSTFICSLCHAEKMVKESPLNGRISIEWKSKPAHPRNKL